MTHLIDKSDVVLHIKKMMQEHHSGYLVCLKDILSFLDTLEVKEVDLKEEIQSWVEDNSVNGYYREDVYETAEHFFELGMAVSNSATASDL